MLKKLYREFFYVPKYGKVREKVLMSRIAMSVTVMVLCLAAMSFSAYAYFTHSATSFFQTIQTAAYDLDVTAPEGVQAVDDDCFILDNSQGNEAKIFAFEISKAEDATASVGYCTVKIATDVNDIADKADRQVYYTQPIGTYLERDAAGNVTGSEPVTRNTRVVNITVERGKTAKVWFLAEWGTCTMTPIVEDKDGIVPEYGALREVESLQPEEDPPAETTAPTQPVDEEATQPTTSEPPEETTTTAPAEPETQETTAAEDPVETTEPTTSGEPVSQSEQTEAATETTTAE